VVVKSERAGDRLREDEREREMKYKKSVFKRGGLCVVKKIGC
jgi:hypothetical protein